MTDTTHTTLVLGGTGKTGRRVAQRLAALGHPVRIGSRSGRPPFDWADQGHLDPRAARCRGGVRFLPPGRGRPALSRK